MPLQISNVVGLSIFWILAVTPFSSKNLEVFICVIVFYFLFHFVFYYLLVLFLYSPGWIFAPSHESCFFYGILRPSRRKPGVTGSSGYPGVIDTANLLTVFLEVPHDIVDSLTVDEKKAMIDKTVDFYTHLFGTKMPDKIWKYPGTQGEIPQVVFMKEMVSSVFVLILQLFFYFGIAMFLLSCVSVELFTVVVVVNFFVDKKNCRVNRIHHPNKNNKRSD